MKKVLVITLMLLVAATVANASATAFLWNAGTYNTAGGKGTSSTFGYNVSPAAPTNWTLSTTGDSGGAAVLGYTGTPGVDFSKTAAYKLDRRSVNPTSWYLVVFAENGFTSDTNISFRIWASTASANKPAGTWYVNKLFTPSTTGDGTWGREQVGVINADAITTNGSAGSPWWSSASLPVFKTNTPAVNGQGYIFELTQNAPTVPEPGSMVALFSGLVGLVGFGIRRRK